MIDQRANLHLFARMIVQSRAHLTTAGESYFQHWRFATTVGLMAMAAGIACLIHALVPALCTRTASRTIGLIGELFQDRDRLEEIEARSIEATAFVLLIGLATLIAAPLWLLDTPFVLRLGYTGMTYALPLTLLLTNRELDAPAEEATG